MTRSPQVNDDLAALLQKVAQRDASAFGAVYEHTRARVFGLVVRVVKDHGYSEEITQEIYLQVWQNATQFNPAMGSALAWLLTLAHRRAVDRVRVEQAAVQRDRRYGLANAGRPADVVVDSAIASDEQRRVADCLDSLTDMQRQSIELAYYGGLTYTQVAERLSVNLSTVKSRMRDGLQSLRNCLGV